MHRIPRIVVAGQSSGVGKTTLTVGLNAALTRQGHWVQPFKCGPDYIDPMYHSQAAGHICRNLDTWMLPKERVKQNFIKASHAADIALIEGVMGLYDGYEALTERGSTAEIAKLLDAPVILVINAAKMARSVAAIAQGYRDFDPAVQIGGVICNNVGSERHARWVTEAVESIGLPVLGCVPRNHELHIPERHLGLLTAVERQAEVTTFLEQSADLITRYIDMEKVWSLACSAKAIHTKLKPDTPLVKSQTVRIAVARDEAFCFYYEDNFDYLRSAGATICEFSPLHDDRLPEDVAAIYLGGGYPELYAAQLGNNESMMDGLRQAIGRGMPVYAECGGLMLLTETLIDIHGDAHPMLGVLPGQVVMGDRVRLGYREVTALQDTPILSADETVRGHEFHYSSWHYEDHADFQPAYRVTPRNHESDWREGVVMGNLHASYVHLHFGTKPAMATRFVEQARRYQI